MAPVLLITIIYKFLCDFETKLAWTIQTDGLDLIIVNREQKKMTMYFAIAVNHRLELKEIESNADVSKELPPPK